MRWSDNIALKQPLRQVRRLADAPQQPWQDLLREREDAAREQGRREGEKALSEQLLEERARIAEVQRGVLDSLRGAVGKVFHEGESALVRLALEAAQKVVAGLPINAEMVQAVVQEALSQVEDRTEIIVQLHPDDLALLQENDASVLADVPGSGPVRFACSPEIARGGCRVQTRFGLIDARREVKFNQLQEHLSQ